MELKTKLVVNLVGQEESLQTLATQFQVTDDNASKPTLPLVQYFGSDSQNSAPLYFEAPETTFVFPALLVPAK